MTSRSIIREEVADKAREAGIVEGKHKFNNSTHSTISDSKLEISRTDR